MTRFSFCNFVFACFVLVLKVHSQKLGDQLNPWKEGFLDIHHINTGRGDSAFYIFPDGTTLLVDAGDTSESHPRTLSARNSTLKPNDTKTAPQWIVDYINQFFPKDRPKQLDYALITHYHDDHFGEVDENRKISNKGGYVLTGIMEVGSLFPIRTIIDRGSDYPIPLKDTKIQENLARNDKYHMVPTLNEYWKFIDYHKANDGLIHQTLEAGKLNQIKLKNTPNRFPKFKIRNIAVNGNIWTGEGNEYFSLFTRGQYFGENRLSTCIKITYGPFDYFTGGDINGINEFGESDINSVESNIAPVVGAVDVATLNHHGNRDSQNVFYVRTLRPRVWIQQNWSADHPGEEVLQRITSTTLYPGKRDIFSTVMLQANKDVIGGDLDQYKSQKGHIVLRVYEKGAKYDIYILNDDSEKREILAKFGPYQSR